MKKIIFASFMFFCSHAIAQKLDIEKPNITIKEGKEKVTETIGFSIKTDKDSVKILVKDDNKLSAEKGKDYEMEGLGTIWLCKKNDHKAKIKIIVLPDDFEEIIEDGKISFTFKEPRDTSKTIEQEINFSITNSSDGSSDAPEYNQTRLKEIKE
jgi:hypothetical protein